MEDKAIELVNVQGELQLLALACRGASQLFENKLAVACRDAKGASEVGLATAPDIFYSIAERLDVLAVRLDKLS